MVRAERTNDRMRRMLFMLYGDADTMQPMLSLARKEQISRSPKQLTVFAFDFAGLRFGVATSSRRTILI
jgi:hypothetical protein